MPQYHRLCREKCINGNFRHCPLTEAELKIVGESPLCTQNDMVETDFQGVDGMRATSEKVKNRVLKHHAKAHPTEPGGFVSQESLRRRGRG